eukprot:Skav211410  [mRNA]  locus=scaffold1528:469106:470656:+ [translate_table: standard]
MQAVFALCFCTQQGYGIFQFVSQQETPVLESVEVFFTRGKDAFWHVFDFILNIVSILDIFVNTWEGRFVHGLAAMRVVRAFRLFRIFASSKFLNDFSRVMHTALLQMLNFCLVIVLSLVLASVVATNMLWDFPDEHVAESYSDLGTTMWTLFKIMTMDGWTVAIQPCLELHPSLLYFFALFVFFSLSSISIVPAIFIELLIEERDKRKLEKQRKRRRRRRAIQRAVSIREINEDQESSDSSCNSSSASSLGGYLRRSSIFAGHQGQNDLWFAISNLLHEHQRRHAVEASWRFQDDDEPSPRYNQLPTSAEQLHEGVFDQPVGPGTNVLELKKDIHLLHQRLVEQIQQLKHDIFLRLDRELPTSNSIPFSHSSEPAQRQQPEVPIASSDPKIHLTSREGSLDSFPDANCWRAISPESVTEHCEKQPLEAENDETDPFDQVQGVCSVSVHGEPTEQKAPPQGSEAQEARPSEREDEMLQAHEKRRDDDRSEPVPAVNEDPVTISVDPSPDMDESTLHV